MNCGHRPKWADDKRLQKKWSPDVVFEFALTHDLFDPVIVPCTTTLYGWIDKGIMRTTSMYLTEKLSRKPKDTTYRNRKISEIWTVC
nr:hypothetical protein [Marinilactibacillus kalidii]